VRVAGGSWHSHYDDKVMWWRCEQHGWLHALIQPKVSPIFGRPLLGGVMEVRRHLPCSHLSLVAKNFFENIMEVFTPILCIQRMHIAFFIKIFNKVLQEKYKD
jgi:hypothetical protein